MSDPCPHYPRVDELHQFGNPRPIVMVTRLPLDADCRECLIRDQRDRAFALAVTLDALEAENAKARGEIDPLDRGAATIRAMILKAMAEREQHELVNLGQRIATCARPITERLEQMQTSAIQGG